MKKLLLLPMILGAALLASGCMINVATTAPQDLDCLKANKKTTKIAKADKKDASEKFECAFIYVAPGLDPSVNRAVIESTDINMNVVGCATYDEAEEVVKEMVAKGCTGIELCAGFGNEGIARMKKAAGEGVAVGAVKFDFHPAFEFKSGDEMFQ